MKYNNPPIVEAVFDIRVSNTQINDVSEIESLKNTLLSEFPISNKRINFQGKIELNVKENKISSSGASNISGYIFSNKENNRKIQFRTDGYTCNFLNPYTSWNEFSTLGYKYWKLYKDFAKPDVITRIALRYINRIELPLDNSEFENFLTGVPRIPKSMPQTFDRYFIQMKIPCEDKDVNATISQTFENPESNYLPFIIDIDVFQQLIIPSEENLEEKFNKLREIKNKIFEDLITEKTRELFN